MCISLPKGDNKKILGFNAFINLVKPTFLSSKLFFVNKQRSYFFPLRRFLNLINLMSINFKLINLMSMNFANKQISYFFHLDVF